MSLKIKKELHANNYQANAYQTDYLCHFNMGKKYEFW